jgi:hypothetical protein
MTHPILIITASNVREGDTRCFTNPRSNVVVQQISSTSAGLLWFHCNEETWSECHSPNDLVMVQRTSEGNFHPGRHWQPDWTKFSSLGVVASVADAMDQYYKHDRLNRPGGMREILIASGEAALAKSGFTCLASHHDSKTGDGIWARNALHGIELFSDHPHDVTDANVRRLETMRFNQTYAVITDESAEEGDAAEQGFDWQDESMTFRELVERIQRDYSGAEPSQSNGVPSWITAHGDRDYTDGTFRDIALHPANTRAKRWWGRALVCAGVIKASTLQPSQVA